MEEVKNKYHNGKIYVIKSKQTDKVFIGSTCLKLDSRLLCHRQYKRRNDRTGEHNVAANILIDYDDHYIELLEKYKCNNKEELRKREGEYIKQHMDICVNKKIAGQTSKEYYDVNRNTILTNSKNYRNEHKERTQKYYEENKNKLVTYKATKIKCVCGQNTTQGHKARHEKSKIHLLFMSSQPKLELDKSPLILKPVKKIVKKEVEESTSDSSSDTTDDDTTDDDDKVYKPTQEQQDRLECAKLRILGWSKTQKQHDRYDELIAKLNHKHGVN